MFKTIITAIVLFGSSQLLAGTQDEINHLIDFVEKTSCKYERNGSMHTGADAKEHIVKKYEYFKEKGKINSAEDFIKYSATKSELSGKKYKVHCPGATTQSSSDWLLSELKEYRKTNP